MSQAPAVIFKIPTKIPQLVPNRIAESLSGAISPGEKAVGRSRSPVFGSGSGRAATRGSGEVVELDHGIRVYPARDERSRWRAVWHEAGQRQQCEAATEEKLAAMLEKVKIRLAKGALAGRRPPLPAPAVSVAGESALWVEPAEIPSDRDISRPLGHARSADTHGLRRR